MWGCQLSPAADCSVGFTPAHTAPLPSRHALRASPSHAAPPRLPSPALQVWSIPRRAGPCAQGRPHLRRRWAGWTSVGGQRAAFPPHLTNACAAYAARPRPPAGIPGEGTAPAGLPRLVPAGPNPRPRRPLPQGGSPPHPACAATPSAATAGGRTTTHALGGLEPRGVLFVEATAEVYEGMIVGEHSRWGTAWVPCRPARGSGGGGGVGGGSAMACVSVQVRWSAPLHC